MIKGRRGGGGGLAGNRDFPGYIPVLSPTVNPINQSKQWNGSQNDIKQVSEECKTISGVQKLIQQGVIPSMISGDGVKIDIDSLYSSA